MSVLYVVKASEKYSLPPSDQRHQTCRPVAFWTLFFIFWILFSYISHFHWKLSALPFTSCFCTFIVDILCLHIENCTSKLYEVAFLICCFFQGDTLDYLGIPGLHLAGSQGILVIAVCQFLLMVSFSYCDIVLVG